VSRTPSQGLQRLALPLRSLLIAVVIGIGGSQAQGVGSLMPPLEIRGLHQSPASHVEELAGRALLIEFFAHW